MSTKNEKNTQNKILIVDDEVSVCRALKRILRKEGYLISEAHNGEEALALCSEKNFDLILTDVRMPIMSGYEFSNRLRQTPKTAKTPIIFMSGMNDTDVQITAFKMGGVDFLIKPFTNEVAIARIATHLKLSSSLQELHNKKEVLKTTVEELKTVRDTLNQYINIVDQTVITSSTDTRGVITYVSDAFCKISQYSRDELVGKPHKIIRHPDMPKDLFEDLWKTIKSGKTWHGELKNRAKDGSFYWVEAHISPDYDKEGEISGYTAIRNDITAKKYIEKMAVTDQLTGIFNRIKLDEVLNGEIKRFQRTDDPFSIILFDVDFFKSVNDTYGHMVGDKVLICFAQISQNNIRCTDTLGRWGGEEFLIICPNTPLENATTLAEKLRLQIEAYEFPEVGRKTASFGIAQMMPDYDKNELITYADEALYKAKSLGRNQVAI